MENENLNAIEILSDIQCELNAPKNMYNSFSDFKYRNLEGILEGLKPLLKKHKCAVIFNDDVRIIGDDFYIISTIKLMLSGGEEFTSVGFARMPKSKPKMDESQVTGSASSYARKYAANALFAINDVQDSDAMDNTVDNNNNNNNDNKPWLNQNDPDFEKIKEAIRSGKRTITQLREKYKVSNVIIGILEGK